MPAGILTKRLIRLQQGRNLGSKQAKKAGAKAPAFFAVSATIEP